MSDEMETNGEQTCLEPPTPESPVVEKAKWASAKIHAPIIPIPKDRKGPTMPGWPERASSDLAEIDRLFTGWPDDSKYGVVVGRGSGVFVLDTDTEAAEALFESLDLPSTFAVKTNRGHHYYYATEDKTVPKHATNIQGLGLDMISNSQCVGPFSVRVDGTVYLPIDPEAEVAVLSAEEVERFCNVLGVDRQAKQHESAPWDPCDIAPDFEMWKRVADATYRVEADYNQNFGWEKRSVSSADPEWQAEARDYLIEKVVTEYGEKIPGTTADRVIGIKPSGTAGQWAVAVSMAQKTAPPGSLDAEQVSVVLNEFAPFVDEEATPPATKGRDHYTLEELLKHPELLVRGEPTSPVFCRKGELSLLAAREKVGKTTLAVWDLVEATKRGTRVMLVSYEESLPRIVTRFKAMGAVPQLTHIVPMPASLARLEELIREHRVEAIVIDSGSSYVRNTKLKVPDTSQAEEWQGTHGEIQAVAIRLNVGICVLVHSPKSESGGVRGSTGIAAAADTIFGMKEMGGRPKLRKLEVKGRWETETRVFEANYESEPTSFKEIETFVAEPIPVRVFKYLLANPGAGVREIRGGVVGSPTDLDAARKELLEAGQIFFEIHRSKHSHFASEEWEPDLLGQNLVPKGTGISTFNIGFNA